MKVVRVTGGLGNQIFQLAYYLFMQQKGFNTALDISSYKTYKLHNGYLLNKIFNKDFIGKITYKNNRLYTYLFSLLSKIPFNIFISYNEYPKIRFKFNHKINYKLFWFFLGYWQTKEYYLNVKEIIQRNLSYDELDSINKFHSKKIISTNSVSIHFRYGDYLLDNDWNTISKEYYIKAIRYFIEKYRNNVEFYVFSDDISAAKLTLSTIERDFHFMDTNKEENSYQDLLLMSLCKHHIIANSTFSWWGAVLNNNEEGITIAPKKWNLNFDYVDLYFPDWILI